MAKRKNHVIKRAGREERAEKRKKAILTYFIVVLMVASVAGFALSGNQSTDSQIITYNNYDFSSIIMQHPLAPDYTINAFVESESEMVFYSSPFETESIPIIGNLSQILIDKPYYIYLFKPDTEFAPLHDWLRFELSTKTNKVLIPALTQSSETYITQPILSCDNSTIEMPIIYIQEGNRTSINITQNGCVQIQTRIQDILFVRDRLFYSLSGIMDK